MRKINDMHQENNDHDNEVRKLLAECMDKVKLIAKLVDVAKRKHWAWEDNPGWEKEVDERIKDDYLQEGSKGQIGKVK